MGRAYSVISLSVFRQQRVVRLTLWLFCFLVSAQAAIVFAQSRVVSKGYCSSTGSLPTVYVSSIFDVASPSRVGGGIDTSPLNAAFKNYLAEEYDFKSNVPYSAGCRVFETLSQTEGSRQQTISEAQHANKQIVELQWNPGPTVAVDHGDSFIIGPKTPPPVHTFCAVGHDDTTYFSDIFDNPSRQNYKTVGDAFNDFLRKRYGFEPQADATCTPMNTVREANEILKARIGGVRYNRHKAVETGWKFDPTGTYKPVQKPTPKVDDDPEPAPRPAPTVPTRSTQDFADKEGPQVLAYCEKDPMLSKIFDCYRVQISVHNYRMEHGTSEPLASLFMQEKVNLAGAIGTGLGLWVRARATKDKFENRETNCIEQKFNVAFYEKPYVSKMNEIYAASVAACKKP